MKLISATIKFLENITSKLLDICLGDEFFNLTPKVKASAAKAGHVGKGKYHISLMENLKQKKTSL